MKDLVKDDRVKTMPGFPIRKRQAVEIAAPHLAMRGPCACELLARERQHLGALIDPNSPFDIGRQQFEHPAGAGSRIEHLTQSFLPKQANDCALHFLFRHMERADLLPARCVLAKIRGSSFGARRAHLRESTMIDGEHCVIAVLSNGAQQPGELAPGTTLCGAIENPCSLFEALEQTRFGQELEMTAYARLTLTHDLGELAHRQFGRDQ